MSDEGPSPDAERLRQSFNSLATALFAEAPLSHRVYDAVGAKVDEPELLDQVIAGMTAENRGFLVHLFTSRLLERAFRTTDFAAEARAAFPNWRAAEDVAIRDLHDLEVREENRYRAVLYLNGPLYDSEAETVLIEFGRPPLAIRLVSVTDEMLGALVEGFSYGARLAPGAELANTALRFDLSRPVGASLADYARLYPVAAEIGRQVLDILRIVHGGDIGISHLKLEPAEWAVPHAPRHQAWDFQSEVAVFNPRRTAFWAPLEPPLNDAQLEEVRALLPAYIRSPEVKGFDMAMRRFRDAWERYHFTDPERLLDMAVSLEALLLNEGDNKELGYRFALRGARLLEEDVGKRQQAFQDLKDLYDFRSKIAHGATRNLKRKDQQKLERLQLEAPSLLRRTLRKTLEGVIPRNLDDAGLARWWRSVELS